VKKHTKKWDLGDLATQVMQNKGLQPKFSDNAYLQLQSIIKPAEAPAGCQDLRALLFCSIDNDDSRDLDQLTFARREKNQEITLWIAIADVDALVPKDSALDQHAQINTTSVYTPAVIFPMLPEKLSCGLTSLNEGENRLALVVEVVMDQEGELKEGKIYQALVRNHAKLAYPSLGAFLEGKGKIPEKVGQVPGLEEALVCQSEAAQVLKKRRHLLGALTLESPEVEAKISQDTVILEPPSHNFADELIEHFMIAANFTMATKLRSAGVPSLRRIVRIPKSWDRIVEIADSFGEKLPEEPSSKALDAFLVKRKAKDPLAFPDLSLVIIKLLGRGEYVVETKESEQIGHFGLALREYVHSTAPNRRFPDLITQRQCKALLQGKKNPYSLEELQILAAHCTQQEDVAAKIERQLSKSAAAILLEPQKGKTFEAVVTGVGPHGVWARIFHPPVEGKIIHGAASLNVGERVKLKLVSVDVPRGHIDFICH
jgi:exoribonuclease-2